MNPYDTRGIARALRQGLEMPLIERRARHEKLIEALHAHDIHAWHQNFIGQLIEARSDMKGTGRLDLRAAST